MASNAKTSRISLSAHSDQFVRGKLRDGEFRTADEVVEESLRIMEAQDRQQQIALIEFQEKLNAGCDQIRRGETVDGDEVFDEIEKLSKAARAAAKLR